MANSRYLDISERKVLLRIIDITLYILSLWFAYTFLDFSYLSFLNSSVYVWIVTLVFYTLLFGEIFQLYDLEVSNYAFKVIKSIVLTTFVTTLFYFFTPFVTPSLPDNRMQILYFFLIITIPIIIWRIMYMTLLFSPKYFKSIAFIGEAKKLKKLLQLVQDNGFHNIAFYISDKKIPGFDNYKNIKTINIKDFVSNSMATELIVTTNNFEKATVTKINKDILALYESGITVKTSNDFYEELTHRIPESYLNTNIYKKINYSKNNENNFYLFYVRFLDIIISVLGLLVFAILLPLLVISNFLGNRGTLFYIQERVGEKGKIFKIYKLRSMIQNAETNGAVWASKNDKRITAFGKFLRNTRLDEFPQFINILKGEMSLIGPRPERPEFVKMLEEHIPFYGVRNVIKPGLTGWAQVNYPYANTLNSQKMKLRYDLYYIKERSLFLDFKTLIKTITTVLFFKGQ